MTESASLKILIVDDHAAVRRTVRQMLEAAHVSTLEACSGEESVKRYTDEHPDWVNPVAIPVAEAHKFYRLAHP